MYGNITDVPGVKVGNHTDLTAVTGCTAIITEAGAVCGVDVRGSAPGTRETDLLDPVNMVNDVHAICLTGGSAYGLEAASGVMDYLEEKRIGLDVGVAKVPIIPSAVLFDLDIGSASTRPNKKMGYKAAESARVGSFSSGNIGVGTGATVGKLLGAKQRMKGGLGSASIKLPNGLVVGAIVAVNAVGDVRSVRNSEILAGAIDPNTDCLIDSMTLLKNMDPRDYLGANTTIGAIGVNAKLTKAEATKVAEVAHNGIARSIYPAHTMADGDTLFTLATGNSCYAIDLISNLAAQMVEEAIINAIKTAESVANIPSYRSRKIT